MRRMFDPNEKWHWVAAEFKDHYLVVGPSFDERPSVRMVRAENKVVGDWLPAEAAAKEILRLRERLAELTTALHEASQKLQNGMDVNPSSSCDIFATLLYMHGLWFGRDLTAAKPADDGAGGA